MNDSRTWLSSVLFLDIVGYSKVPVDQQMSIKLHFTELVAEQVDSLGTSECIELDTGDGCAICYMGDPEKLYPVATRLREQFASLAESDKMRYAVRMGLNLGPVKIVEGISGEKNCVGAGINDAQRIMDFAGENQLLVSKSYFDIVSNMSSTYSEQLVSAGARADKHDKIHEVYELASLRSDVATPSVAAESIHLDAVVRQRLIDGYAKYVGRAEAETRLAQTVKLADSSADVCDRLASQLNEDDRYHFNEFVEYYGLRAER